MTDRQETDDSVMCFTQLSMETMNEGLSHSVYRIQKKVGNFERCCSPIDINLHKENNLLMGKAHILQIVVPDDICISIFLYLSPKYVLYVKKLRPLH